MSRRLIVCVGVLAVLGVFPATSASASKPSSHLKVTSYARPVCSVSTSPKYASCMAWVKTDKAGTPMVSPNVAVGMTPAQFHTAYNLPMTVTGKPTIAIVDAYKNPNIYTDLQRYQERFHVSTFHKCKTRTAGNCLFVLNERGRTSPLPPSNPGWSTEISLDVEIARAICQNCRIELFEADSASFHDLMVAVNTAADRGAEVISNSYGAYGYDCGPRASYNHPGIAITVSAGDNGYGVACPANLNTVVSVGGTSLTLNGDNSYNSETVWSGSGSGCSTANTAQSWQSGNANWPGIACSGRGMNDVSADADPNTGAAILDSYGAGGWVQVGGTSLSAPLIAGVYALAGNASDWSYPAQSVYVADPSNFNDVTTGTNGTCGGLLLTCNAGSGYDLPTGIGTPNGLGGF
jgi:subtilase family serine protease